MSWPLIRLQIISCYSYWDGRRLEKVNERVSASPPFSIKLSNGESFEAALFPMDINWLSPERSANKGVCAIFWQFTNLKQLLSG